MTTLAKSLVMLVPVALVSWEAPSSQDILALAKDNVAALTGVPAQTSRPQPLAAAVFSCYPSYFCQGPSMGQIPSSGECRRAGGHSWVGNDMLCHNLKATAAW